MDSEHIISMKELIIKSKALSKARRIKLVEVLMSFYCNVHTINYIQALTDPSARNIMKLFSFADFILYELEEAQEKLKEKFEVFEKTLYEHSQDMKPIDENFKEIKMTDELMNKLVHSHLSSIVFKDTLKYLIKVWIEGLKIDPRAYIDECFNERPLGPELTPELLRQVKTMELNLMEISLMTQ